MLWKRSKIADYSYEFPAKTVDLTLEKEKVKVSIGYAVSSLKEAYDPEGALNFEEAVVGQEIIYTLDENNELIGMQTIKAWEGPEIEPNGEIEWEFHPVDDLLEYASEMNPEALYPENMKDAIIGTVERFSMQPQILLDREKCIAILMKDGMAQDEAEEFFEVNTIGAWMGEGTPCFATIDKALF